MEKKDKSLRKLIIAIAILGKLDLIAIVRIKFRHLEIILGKNFDIFDMIKIIK